MSLMKSDVSFEVDGNPVSFSVVHNMPEIKGLSFEDALINWLNRTTEFTVESFCSYVRSKDVNVFINPHEPK